eukprot:113444_1
MSRKECSQTKLMSYLVHVFIMIAIGCIFWLSSYYDMPHVWMNNIVTKTQFNQSNCNTHQFIEFNRITFISNHSLDIFKSNFPPFLLSYPSSGNTYVRLLLEYTTLYWTGSVFGSPLKPIGFKGESRVDETVIAIKMHPIYGQKKLFNIINIGNVNFTEKRFRKKYMRIWHTIQNILHTHNEHISAIFILKDVFSTCWSNFQFNYAMKYDSKIKNPKHLSSFIMTANTFKTELLSKWKVFCLHCANNWMTTFEWIEMFKKMYKKITMVEIDKLTDKRYMNDEMLKILHFLFNANYLKQKCVEQGMMKRLENTILHMQNLTRFELVYRNKNRQNRIDKSYAYSLLSDHDICTMLQSTQNQSYMLNDMYCPRKVNCV